MNLYLNDWALAILENEQNQRANTLLAEMEVLDNLASELSYDQNNEDLKIKLSMQQDRMGAMKIQFSRELQDLTQAAQKEVYGMWKNLGVKSQIKTWKNKDARFFLKNQQKRTVGTKWTKPTVLKPRFLSAIRRYPPWNGL